MNLWHMTPENFRAHAGANRFPPPRAARPVPRPVVAAGSFSGAAAGVRGACREPVMTEDRSSIIGRLAARAAVVIVGLVLAIAVGAPFLLYDAPPSPEAVFAASLCCASAPGIVAPPSAPALAPSPAR
jgi:hypothetical protein